MAKEKAEYGLDRTRIEWPEVSSFGDDWIKTHQELPPAHLHALGCLSLYYNSCEHALFGLFCDVANVTEKRGRILVHDMDSARIWQRISDFAEIDLDAEMLAHIEHARRIFDVCKSNRNSYIHAILGASDTPDKPLGLKFQKGKFFKPKSVDDSLETIRRVADEIEMASRYIATLGLRIHFYRNEKVQPAGERPPSLGKPAIPKSLR